MLGRTKARLRKYLGYYRVLDVSSLFLCTVDKIFRREIVRLITVDGFHVYVRTNSSDLLVAVSSLQDKEYDHIVLADPKVIIDGGANIGTSSLYFAAKYPNARVFAIEPESGNFALLVRNTKNYKNIVPIKAAIWGSLGARTVQNRCTGHWGFTVSDTSNRVEPTGQEIDCVTIESLMKEHGIAAIDLLKLDIEGGEKDVLEKSAAWIDAVGTISVELHDRICMGCSRAFYLATKDFKNFEKHGEKVTAHRS
jgi:FkbM family methyltransferase